LCAVPSLARRPIPLYSTFEDVRLVALHLDAALDEEDREPAEAMADPRTAFETS
jgi:hypothetical protein